MSATTIKHILIQLLLATAIVSGQAYKAEYNRLTKPLIDKDPLVICILEEGSSIFDTLGQYPEFTKKYICYSSEALSGLREILKVDVLDPENQKFRQALRNKLSVGYILNWKSSPESDGVFLLEIFSTQTSSRIYTKKYFPSINSNPFQDAKKLLIDSMEVYYTLPSGEIAITTDLEAVRFKLMKGEELVLEWKGNLRQQTVAGTYKLISEADNYISRESEIEVLDGETTSVNVILEPQLSLFIKVLPADRKISNIKTDINNQQVTIIYDLISNEESEFNIGAELTNKKTGKVNALKMISGDITKVKSGTKKIIQWQMFKELGSLPDNEYEIKLTAIEAGGYPWYYYASGGALLGGVILLLGGGGDDNPGPSSSGDLAIPPGRP